MVQTEAKQLISVVDDDRAFREATANLLRSNLFEVECFSSAQAFVDSGRVKETKCLILDVRMPGMSGLQLQRHLVKENRRIPIIFMTAHGSPELRQEAMRVGAVDFLPKPFNEKTLLNAIQNALRSRRNNPVNLKNMATHMIQKSEERNERENR